ncbi:hypothetical protein H4R34_001204 [Dimargaris verticillata]|uniref:Uncharacterized protein n=1 Tax=Dimargaris verticillata TaxID=2761393 RepID=A0A9W8B8Y7_9FUNG|nr:hypothetical protein H4R34_001204 [Dimargaris verticillata]
MRGKSFVNVALLMVLSAALVHGHASQYDPCVQRTDSKDCQKEFGDALGDQDNDHASPMSSAKNYEDRSGVANEFELCKYRPTTVTKTYKAGGTYKMTAISRGNHDGGHCQIFISYDNGETFLVIQNIPMKCFAGVGDGSLETWDFDLPAGIPSGEKVLLGFFWNNATGYREAYMNCAYVKIEGQAGGSITGPALNLFNVALTIDGKKTAFILPEFKQNEEDKAMAAMFGDEGRPMITYTGEGQTSVTGSGIFPAYAGQAVAVGELTADEIVYVDEKTDFSQFSIDAGSGGSALGASANSTAKATTTALPVGGTGAGSTGSTTKLSVDNSGESGESGEGSKSGGKVDKGGKSGKDDKKGKKRKDEDEDDEDEEDEDEDEDKSGSSKYRRSCNGPCLTRRLMRRLAWTPEGLRRHAW